MRGRPQCPGRLCEPPVASGKGGIEAAANGSRGNERNSVIAELVGPHRAELDVAADLWPTATVTMCSGSTNLSLPIFSWDAKGFFAERPHPEIAAAHPGRTRRHRDCARA